MVNGPASKVTPPKAGGSLLPNLAAMTDGELLEHFATRHEEPAFAELVSRHGPMVLRTCQRVLHRPQDAEDAFQAAFIVLVRRAGALSHIKCLGSWLHAVAARVALKARGNTGRRQSRERQTEEAVLAEAVGRPSSEAGPSDLRPVLDEELTRLPEKYRAPIVLCYLEGKSTDQTADQLGWKRGTVACRLSRARDLLRNRLRRRGLALSAGALGVMLTQQALFASVPATLTGATTQAAMLTAAGKAAGADATLKSMAALKLKIAAALLAVTAVVGGAVMWPADPWPLRATLNNPGGVLSVSFSPDGSKLVTSSSDGLVKVWDLAARQPEAIFEGHGGDAAEAVFTTDGKTLAVGTGDGFVQVFDLNSRQQRLAFRAHTRKEGVASLALAPGGKTLATAGWDKTVKLWDPATGSERAVLRDHTSGVSCVRYSADGQWLASASNDGTVKLWDPASGALRATLRGHAKVVGPLAFSPDCRTLASGSPRDDSVILWDVAEGKAQRTFAAHPGGVMALAFSPDGRLLVTGGGGQTARIWDLATGVEQATLRGHTREVSALAFSPRGKILATASYDGTVRLWGAATDR
jgi:RNA polymerase sigma factor (sigma-70 family)